MNQYDIYRYSPTIGHEMNIKVYGHYGQVVLAFPCQDKYSNDWENEGMIANLADYIDGGQIKLYVVDSIDLESISYREGDKGHRAWRQEQYYQWIFNEVIPIIYEDCHGTVWPLVTGCSMGANHATTVFLRRPDLFMGLLAFSGVYNLDYFYDGWCNEVLYESSPLRFLPNMSNDHPYIGIYNTKKIIFCIGQGAWEDLGLPTQHQLQEIFYQKGINAWFDYWGYDVPHDWCSWKQQIRYFLPKILYE